ncbi:stretch-activated Ca2+-permeable channel component-domain-containing protein [Myxozyma melibiosi]|uniref:Stretch-activated Ca2+-permeable channel component-domain-containing protein n=1 Tax=Myxozyma melibiosi TaxID=54550 RepID=A0ABR1F3E3_9ASCO
MWTRSRRKPAPRTRIWRTALATALLLTTTIIRGAAGAADAEVNADAVWDGGKQKGYEYALEDELGGMQIQQAGYFAERLEARAVEYTALTLNTTLNYDLSSGTSSLWRYKPSDDDDDDDDADFFAVYVSVCSQPSLVNDTDETTEEEYLSDLTLRLQATSSTKSTMSFSTESSIDYNETVDYGFAAATWDDGYDNIFINITTPEYDSSKWSGTWTIQLLATTASNVTAGYSNTSSVFLLDTDYDSALFLTAKTPDNGTAADDDIRPYRLYVYPNDTTSLTGLNRSYCAVRDGGYTFSDEDADVNTTNVLWDDYTRETMHLKGLAAATTYTAYLAQPDESVSGIGVIYPSISFTTKKNSTCQIIYNLDFCVEVAYSAPSNSSMSMNALKNWYDDTAKSLYDGFNKSMQLTPCDVSDEDRYSLMRTCDQCLEAYRRWLCLTLIPRCFDDTGVYALPVSTTGSYEGGWEHVPVNGTALRSAGESRNDMINNELKPESYIELQPCSYTCHKVMQNCPVGLTFQCPSPDKGLYDVYGRVNANVSNGDIFMLENATCNFLGYVDKFGAASGRGLDVRVVVGVACISGILLLL